MVNMQEQINGKQAVEGSAAAEAVSAHPKLPDVQRITQTDTENNREGTKGAGASAGRRGKT